MIRHPKQRAIWDYSSQIFLSPSFLLNPISRQVPCFGMVAKQKSTPVGAIELKAVIYRKIGRQRAENYFDLLKRFLSLKVMKCDFDESCLKIIGRENLSLHNHFIRTILRTILASSLVGEVPLSRAKNKAVVASPNVEVADGLPVNSGCLVNSDNKFCDRSRPLGPLWENEQSETERFSLGSRSPIVSVEDGEEVEQADGKPAPLGISMYKGAGKAPSSGT